LDIRHAARPHLERLVSELGETAHLTVLRGTNVLFIDGVESPHILRAAARIGHSLPAHATAAGSVMLATLPEEMLIQQYPDECLEPLTKRTVTSRRALLRQLAEIRERGTRSTTAGRTTSRPSRWRSNRRRPRARRHRRRAGDGSTPVRRASCRIGAAAAAVARGSAKYGIRTVPTIADALLGERSSTGCSTI
jgi:hypothetical protein